MPALRLLPFLAYFVCPLRVVLDTVGAKDRGFSDTVRPLRSQAETT